MMSYQGVQALRAITLVKSQRMLMLSNWTVDVTLHQQFWVVFSIYNCYICFNGNKFMNLFDLPPPSLADYLDA